MCKMSVGKKRLVGLNYVVVFLFVGCNISYFVCNNGLTVFVLNDYSVRSFDKAIFIDSCECCK